MEIRISSGSDCSIINVSGDFDYQSEMAFSSFTNDLTSKNLQKLILDFSGIEWIDSSALNSVLDLYWKVEKSGGKLVLCCVSERIRNLLCVTRIEKLLTLAENLDSARKLLSENK